MKSKKILLISCLILTYSCASNYRPESFDDKMARYVPRTKQENRVPKIEISKKILSRRSPSSTSRKMKSSLPLSNKNLYFLTLYGQYKSLKRYSVQDHNEIKICPHFHSLVVERKDIFDQYEKRYNWEFSGNQSIEPQANPTLALPVLSQQEKPSVYDLYAADKRRDLDQLIKKGLGIHVEKTFKEISELCEYGSSDNYYIFENLVGQVRKDDKGISQVEDIQTMLKTTLYFNMALIKSLKKFRQGTSRNISSMDQINVFNEEIFKRSKSHWGKLYVEGL